MSVAEPILSYSQLGEAQGPFGAPKKGRPVDARVRASAAISSPRPRRRQVRHAIATVRHRHAIPLPDSVARRRDCHREMARLLKNGVSFSPMRRPLDTARDARYRRKDGEYLKGASPQSGQIRGVPSALAGRGRAPISPTHGSEFRLVRTRGRPFFSGFFILFEKCAWPEIG